MVWLYLIVQSFGLAIIAWCFKMEGKRAYATASNISGLFSLLIVIGLAPFPINLLTGMMMMIFRSKVYLIFADGLEATRSFFRTSLQAMTAGSISFDAISHWIQQFWTTAFSNPTYQPEANQQAVEVEYPPTKIIDIEAIEVSPWG
ncbi:MAG: hypothetical protein QNJ46_20880 [Leptolyngbyaceae cyanobacterium MO_188.B28]|nr:hypothetical protein [Leptolyngbyaceae cyanobacterium MO_188.B28]